jgi:hypothetical protein
MGREPFTPHPIFEGLVAHPARDLKNAAKVVANAAQAANEAAVAAAAAEDDPAKAKAAEEAANATAKAAAAAKQASIAAKSIDDQVVGADETTAAAEHAEHAAEAAKKAAQGHGANAAEAAGNAAEAAEAAQDATKALINAMAQVLADMAERFPDVTDLIEKQRLVLRAGFIAGQVNYAGSDWVLVFEIWGGDAWMLVRRDSIPRKGIKFSGDIWLADAIWIDRNATVRHGSELPVRVERMFLDGSLTVAGDLDQTLGSRGGRDAGLFSPQSPPLCGCGKKTR